MISPRKTANTRWVVGGAVVALAMIWLAESHAPPRHKINTSGTNSTATPHKNFQSLLKNIKTTSKHSVEEKEEPQTLLIQHHSGVPEPADGPMATLAMMDEVKTFYLDQLDMSMMAIPAAWDTDWLLAMIKQDPSVKYADVNDSTPPIPQLHLLRPGLSIHPASRSFGIKPDDPYFHYQHNLDDQVGEYTNKLDYSVDVDAPEAWAYTTGSENVVVAVFDAGINLRSTDLRPNLWVNEAELNGVTGVDDDGNNCVDDIHGCRLYAFVTNDHRIDDNGDHGTAMASIIGARGNNGHGIAGIAWNIRIMTLAGVIGITPVINYILQKKNEGVNIRVLNVSLGLGANEGVDCIPSALSELQRMERDVVRQLGDAGVVLVHAIGNDATHYQSDTQLQPKPACFDLDNIIAVAGQDGPSRTRYATSSYGRVVTDLMAPGADVPVLNCGQNIYHHTNNCVLYNDTVYTNNTGTSLAAAHVSGAAALLWSFRPDLTVTEVRSALLDTVDRFPAFTDAVASGGALNIANALYSVATPGIRIHSSQTTITATNNGYLDLSLTREPVRPSSGEVVVLEGAAMTPPDTNATITSSTLTFTSANWHIPQRMSVQATGTDDSELLLQISVNTARSTTDYRSLPVRTATFTLQNENRATNTEPEPMPILCQKLRTTMANTPNP